jgi:ubiquinone/menaquinone biosynthesis C-methylase UbiE
MFLELAQWDKGDELIDCGAGTGRASKALADAGLDVTMLDITREATDPGIKLPFVEYCLWDMGLVDFVFDWVYCCDVLEHIPTEHVDEVLDNLATMTGYGAFMQIAMFPEIHGARYVGEALHLTIKPADWWKRKLAERWIIKHELDSGDNRLIVLTGEAR